MQFKLFIIPISDTGKFTEEMNAFLRSNKILQVEKHFVNDPEGSYWTFCIQYIEKTFQYTPEKKDKIDYKNVLDEPTFERFSILREIRKQIAIKEAVPAYMIFTDEELSRVAKLQDITVKTLLTIKGIGEKKIERFGEQFIQALQEHISNEKNKQPNRENQ